MEGVYGTHNESKSTTEEDFITSMPENVITDILERLPIKDAVRTGNLSRNWRSNWNMLTQVVIDDNFFKRGPEGKRYEDERNISRILFQLKGSVTKFKLVIPFNKTLDVKEVSLWVMFLSRKGIKEFILNNYHKTPIKLPSHLFSCLELKHLELFNCCFDPPPNIHGFPNLLTLHLNLVRFESYKCRELITHCPLLQTLSIAYYIHSSKLKLAEIAKLKNLLYLYLSYSALDITCVTTSTIFQFLRSFPKLQELHMNFEECKFLAESGGRKGAPTSFPCLWSIDFGNDMVSYVLEMLCCSPNLQTLRIVAPSFNHVLPTVLTSSAVDCNTMGNLQLRNVMFHYLSCSENELCLIKSLLARSPLLHKMRIGLSLYSMFGDADRKFMFATKLLNLDRASPVAKIDLI